MYDPRYSPVYQIPYEPLFETTKHQIEHGLLSLQEKLRRRRQIERQPPFPLVPYPSSLEYLQHHHHPIRLQQPHFVYNPYEQQNLYREKVASQFDNINRIEKLRLERDLLTRQMQDKKIVEKGVEQRLSYEDDELIKKYENGSMAKRYYEEIQNQRNRIQSEHFSKRQPQQQSHQKHQQSNIKHHQYDQTYDDILQNSHRKFIEDSSPHLKQIKKNVNHRSISNFQSERKDHLPLESNLKRSIYDTPYDKIKQPPKEHIFQQPRSIIKQQNAKNDIKRQLYSKFNKIDEVQQNIKDQDISDKDYKGGHLKNAQEIVSKMSEKDGSPYSKLNKYKSMGKINNRSKSSFSPIKRSFLQEEYLEPKNLSKKTVKEIELSALKKIENRLRVSKVIYQDSQFRNIKYEGNHLYNTYESEIRQRKEIRERINNNTVVLRRHPLVVQ